MVFMTSCISKKRYEEAMTRAAAEKSALESSLATANEENEKLKGDISTLEGNLNMKSEEIVKLSEEIKYNRALLDDAMSQAASALNIPLFPLPQEWWDFRLPPGISNQYAPLSDLDLPEEMRMMPGAV